MRARTFCVTSLALVLLVLAMGMAACANRRITMTPSTSVPAATATVDVGQDRNGNTTIDLRVQHLAQPDRLTPPASTYIVWIQPRDEQPQKQGQLKVGSDLSARFQATTPARQFTLFVTAETDAAATQPSGQEVLRQEINRAQA
jgi:hypothetical protein